MASELGHLLRANHLEVRLAWEEGLGATLPAIDYARAFGKPVFNSETGCIARANAFDQTMEQALETAATFQGIVQNTGDHDEGVAALLEKREPDYSNQ